jgi:hypothetical protein
MNEAQPKRGRIERPGATPERSEGGKRRSQGRGGARPASEGQKQ